MKKINWVIVFELFSSVFILYDLFNCVHSNLLTVDNVNFSEDMV